MAYPKKHPLVDFHAVPSLAICIGVSVPFTLSAPSCQSKVLTAALPSMAKLVSWAYNWGYDTSPSDTQGHLGRQHELDVRTAAAPESMSQSSM